MLGAPAQADGLRIASYNTEFQRKGPGLLLRDILRGEDPQIAAAADVIATVRPDILALQGFDYDLTGAALAAFVETLSAAGIDYAHSFAARPNTGVATGIDLDGDGRDDGPRDAQGFGSFSGQGGMAILSTFEIVEAEIQDFSNLLWTDLPGALLPEVDGAPFPSPEAQAVQRLSTTGHWVIPVDVPDLGEVTLLTFHASPPVFDGPEDRNGRRNHDEIAFWGQFLDGRIGSPPADHFVLLGDANLDPKDGEGRKEAIRGLLSDPRLQDPGQTSAGAKAAGDARDTVDWDDPDPGNLRVDYVLPSADWTVTGGGVYWPAPNTSEAETAARASRHRLVWVDLAR
ncbi:endonuclease/exonuclease/phosphatase family protein [Sulfitobacter sp. D35]|uniref:endonuclease/exonuclease/phosphatase family protein n=1 Tax=Sulfitobacter sp. D35 TaxID=3083252 RepID=UPI00296F45A3|nr:endonuclease/exonuclease/phosphatase family protein [Sulfitobacter sp. D35]MDW4498966.1 endonuclease/exonuclease/phosphatase family protein [Sulfitobacter sp. D35]